MAVGGKWGVRMKDISHKKIGMGMGNESEV
jgi:hypothetical protein